MSCDLCVAVPREVGPVISLMFLYLLEYANAIDASYPVERANARVRQGSVLASWLMAMKIYLVSRHGEREQIHAMNCTE